MDIYFYTVIVFTTCLSVFLYLQNRWLKFQLQITEDMYSKSYGSIINIWACMKVMSKEDKTEEENKYCEQILINEYKFLDVFQRFEDLIKQQGDKGGNNVS